MKAVPASAAAYAAKFRVRLTIEKYGIFLDSWDWVAAPERPDWHPTVAPFRVPVGCDYRQAVRAIAERIGSGQHTPRGFCPVK